TPTGSSRAASTPAPPRAGASGTRKRTRLTTPTTPPASAAARTCPLADAKTTTPQPRASAPGRWRTGRGPARGGERAASGGLARLGLLARVVVGRVAGEDHRERLVG